MRKESGAYLLTGIPDDLRTPLIEESRHRLTSLTSHVVGILAARYELAYEPKTPRGLRPIHSNGHALHLVMPETVLHAVRKEADKRKVAMRSVILTAVAEHFGVEAPPETKVNPKRRPGRPKHGRPRGRMK